MFDCANVEVRELLPDFVGGTLDAATRARVTAHIAECAECASELETLRLVRSAFADAPAVDTARIVASLPKAPVSGRRVAAPSPRARWMDWRVAAALTMVTVGGLSVVVTQQRPPATRVPGLDTPALRVVDDSTPGTSTVAPIASRVPDTGTTPTRIAPPASRAARAELSFGGGGEGDLDDASLRALLGALDEIDRGPVAPSAEPDGSPVLPVIREGGR